MTDTMIEITGLKKEYRLYDTPVSRVREVQGKNTAGSFLLLTAFTWM